MSTLPFLLAGRLCLSFAGVSACVGSFLADFNETHVYNPKWPPHARFHNGQTMSMSAALALSTLYFTWRFDPQTVSVEWYEDSMFTAAILGSMYWLTGMTAILYPGTKWVDPEFDPTGKASPQRFVFLSSAAAAWLGYWLATSGM